MCAVVAIGADRFVVVVGLRVLVVVVVVIVVIVVALAERLLMICCRCCKMQSNVGDSPALHDTLTNTQLNTQSAIATCLLYALIGTRKRSVAC